MPSAAPTSFPSTSPSETPSLTPSGSPTFDCRIRLEQVFEWTAQDVFVDLDQSGFGFTTGDFFAFSNNLVVTGDRPTDGVLYGRCFLLEDREQNLYCSLSIEFLEGRVFMQGAVLDDMNLIGGDGCYSGISGTVEVEIDSFGDRLIPNEETTRPDGCPVTPEGGQWIETPEDVFIDVDRDGFTSTGDVYVFEANNLDAGSKQGTVSGECIITPQSDTFCQISYRFDDGSVTVQ